MSDRGNALTRLKDVAKVELGAEEADMMAKFNEREAVYFGIWPLVGSNEIEVAHRLHAEMERLHPTLPKDIGMELAYDATVFMEDALKEIAKDPVGNHHDRRPGRISLHGVGADCAGAISGDAGFAHRGCHRHARIWIQSQSPDDACDRISVGLVVDDAIVVVENVERHVRRGKSRLDAALISARELLGPIVAMTITLAVVYTPIAFQGGLTGSLFLEFAITLAAAVVVSGVVAVTLSPMMSSHFVHPQGEQGRLTLLVNRAFEAVRRAYAHGLDGALEIPWTIVVASLLVMVAAWPLLFIFTARARAR